MYVVGKPKILNKELFLKRVDDILETSIYSNNGPYVQQLEEYLKELIGCKYVIAVNNATSALEICLAFLKTKVPFGNIIVPSFTFISTVHSIVRSGFNPVFCDIGEDYCLDPESFDLRVNSKTAGCIPVSLFGNYVDTELLSKYRGIFTLLDSAHALNIFNEKGNMAAGNFGDCEVFSLHPTKLMGAFEGGIITTNNPEIYEFAIRYRNFGFNPGAPVNGEVVQMGMNAKMNEIQAAAALCQMENLEDIQSHYFEIYKLYKELLPNWVKLSQPNTYFSNFSYIVCRVHPSILDSLIEYLHSHNIMAKSHFQPAHKMGGYYEQYNNYVLPNTERIAKQVFILPTGLNIEESDVIKICNIIGEFINE